MTYALLNKLTVRPGHRDEVLDLLLASGRLLRDNPACLMYLVSASATDPAVIWVQDLWAGREEHEAFLSRPELRPFIDRTVPLLEGAPEQVEIRPVGGAGASLPPELR
ncbi:putative quinol monooxygenase [Longispora urticae]